MQQPTGPAALSTAPPPCFAGDGPAGQRCPRCGRWFCSNHGRALCAVCRRPRGLAPSPLLFYGTLLLLTVSSALAVFQLSARHDDWAVSLSHGLVRALTPAPAPTAAPDPTATANPAAATTPSPSVTATAVAEATAIPAPQRTHVIQPGDTLLGLAIRFDVALEALEQANPNVNPAALRIGQELVVPGPNP